MKTQINQDQLKGGGGGGGSATMTRDIPVIFDNDGTQDYPGVTYYHAPSERIYVVTRLAAQDFYNIVVYRLFNGNFVYEDIVTLNNTFYGTSGADFWYPVCLSSDDDYIYAYTGYRINNSPDEYEHVVIRFAPDLSSNTVTSVYSYVGNTGQDLMRFAESSTNGQGIAVDGSTMYLSHYDTSEDENLIKEFSISGTTYTPVTDYLLGTVGLTPFEQFFTMYVSPTDGLLHFAGWRNTGEIYEVQALNIANPMTLDTTYNYSGDLSIFFPTGTGGGGVAGCITSIISDAVDSLTIQILYPETNFNGADIFIKYWLRELVLPK